MEEPEVLLCECCTPEHNIVIYKFDYIHDISGESYDREVMFTPCLSNHHTFLKRMIIGLRYIFKQKDKYPHWDSILITKNNYEPLKRAVEFLEENVRDNH